jgi:hypothetical protein
VGISPSATAAYLLEHHNDEALSYLRGTLRDDATGIVPALSPIDLFEIAWALNILITADAITPDDPQVYRLTEMLWSQWSNKTGISMSTSFTPDDVDDTAAVYSVLRWAGYPVRIDAIAHYETEVFFVCYPHETNHSISAHLRILLALKNDNTNHPDRERWVTKILTALHKFKDNGTFWRDKWHVSPYYVNAMALMALHDLDENHQPLVYSRLTWMLKTQLDDGGWGVFDVSTPEETAYCVQALIWWDRHVSRIDPEVIRRGASFLLANQQRTNYVPLWIGKALYTPRHIVRASIASAVYSYVQWEQ